MMQDRYTYLLVDLCCIVVPFISSFHPWVKFHLQWRSFFIPCILTALFFIGWDMVFTHMGAWRFNPRYLLGYYVFNLPVEELAFFVCIPYACVFTFHLCQVFIKRSFPERPARVFTMFMIGGLLLLALLNPSRYYTSITFVLLSLLLSFLLIRKVRFLTLFYISFAYIILPFLISNGILTGSFIDEPVVIYNNSFNLGLRIFTIPVEDVFYGMLLLLMNVCGYVFLQNRNVKHEVKHE